MSENDISDYKNRLVRARFPPTIDEGVNMTYGFPSQALTTLRDAMLAMDHHQWAIKVGY